MRLAEGIRKLGFITWHERELLIGHGWLVLTLLSGVVAFAALEVLLGSDDLLAQAKYALGFLAAGAVGTVALYRFLYRLGHAQKTSAQAICEKCKTFGRFAVVAEDRDETWVRVRCKRCAHEWVMDDTQ